MTGPDRSEGDVNLGPARAAWRHAAGPAGQALVTRDERVFLRQSLSTPCLSAVRRAEGIWIEDADGRRYMDFHGNSVHHLGHGHPKIKEAILRQMAELPFAPRRFTCEPAIALAERLTALAPPGLTRVLFAPGGSEAIEIALKLARVATGRHRTLSFWDAFHGAGFGAASVGGEALFRDTRLGPLLPGTTHVPPFACFRCPYGFPSASGAPDLATCRMACARAATFALDREPDIGALVAEPMRAVPTLPPPGFWPELRGACDRHGTLLVFDEIPTGLGKTGRLFACEHSGAVPDILVLGKALGGGMLPLAAVLARADLDVADDLAIGHYTHEKNPILAAAGLATLEVIVQEGLAQRAAELGAYALDRLREIAATRKLIGEVRGLGLLIGIEMVDADGRPATAAAEATLYAALRRGLSFKVTQGSVLTLSPPLIISRDELDQALEWLTAALDEVTTAMASS
ncbi:Aspartate aminotransferase family protein [Rhodovastum atsumiense]|uniref:Aspartate aminotransferase family protein n=1 Tax=Rhodovastum atsumiense TaxID=504468 RepID=A0A5M6IWB8_9PROT|nr:aspartate aminotransferase family protein [Rhodovastum atsumiense]KAA5612620.1 aspartate aminotransferase family protein [Rhodovastum atsumiense]CAH2601279.1 Aspartate aminotransferase family protein [Rhodovastum atsumiense]